ncbi:MAG: hypothetical protein KME15_12430 [Drouetiella hepatica Uher 2000/2452]|jgi:hypothetical protein|uniref:Uncharacterized protein n=1 Tax=Drouetiella hepatica Uher 2000/2452 TaxID=904376 RepID=A0A951QBD9_9CYAN|nr:hypothetical protein [Drouetiella hepatica Uher 2000/2452]
MLKLGTTHLLKRFASPQLHLAELYHPEPCCPTCSLPWSGRSASGRGRFCLVCSTFTIQHPETLDSLELVHEFKDIMRAAYQEYENQHKTIGTAFIKPDLRVIFKNFDIVSDW